MATFPAATLAVLHRQAGHITSAQLAANGLGRSSRQRLVADGVLQRPFKSVYRLAIKAPSFEQRLIALCLAHPAGFITGPTGGRYVKLRQMPKASAIDLCLPHGSPTDVAVGTIVRQSTKIAEADKRRLPNGIVLANWPRLLFDLSADLSARALTSVTDQVLHEGHCTPDELGAIARRLCHPMRRGSQLFVEMLRARGDRRPIESHPELVVLEGLLARGVPVEPQHTQLLLLNGRQVRIDLAVPKVRWAVEVDVHPDHLLLIGTTSDKQRDRQLHLIDWQVERVTEIDLLDPDGICDELAQLYFQRHRLMAA